QTGKRIIYTYILSQWQKTARISLTYKPRLCAASFSPSLKRKAARLECKKRRGPGCGLVLGCLSDVHRS
ncbi:hypothetical protein LEMLEM_LOCUS7170, partial [Lemmus lemmus]